MLRAGEREPAGRLVGRPLRTRAGCLVDERPASASPGRSESTIAEVMPLAGMRGAGRAAGSVRCAIGKGIP